MTTSTVLDTFSAIEQRRSVKHYDASYEMPQADVDKLFDLALLSPTSFNIQNWRFVHVTDPALKEQVKAAAWNQAQITDAQMLLVMCADLHSFKKEPERYWANAPADVQKFLVPMIVKTYDDQAQLQRDEAMRSVGIASQTLMLAAKAMGYDSCPMVGFDPVKVAELINLPSDHVIGMILVIGKAATPARERGGQLPKEHVIIQNKF